MKDKFKKQLLISFGLILGSGIAAAIGLNFLSGNLHASAEKIIQERAGLSAETMALGSLADLKRDAPLAAQYQAAINKLLPDQYHLIGFGQWLNGIAQHHSVSANVSFQGTPTPPSAGAAGTAIFSISTTGSASDVIAFLKDIETQEPAFLLSINSFDLTSDGTTVNVTGQGTLYFQE
jgi:hypothetical protein